MEILLKLTPAEDVQQHVLPMLYRGLDSDTPQIHELCLSVLPTFAGLLDHANVKNSLLPRIKKLCLSTSTLSVRVNCLLCIGRLLEHFDKWLVLDEILPFLPQIPSREPAVLMGILGIYKLTLNHKKLGISKEIIATRILPFLMPLCIENGLTLAQFNALVALCKQMFQIVETEHRTKLEQLNSVQEEQKVLETSFPTIAPPPKPIDSAFSGLGLDNFVSSLSLEEKQKISKQQETIKIMQNQASLEPAPIQKPQIQSKPKDLTTSLLDNSINMFSASKNQQITPNYNLTSPNSTTQNVFSNNIRNPMQSPMNSNWQNNFTSVTNQNFGQNAWPTSPQNQVSNPTFNKPLGFNGVNNTLSPTSLNAFQNQLMLPQPPLTSNNNGNVANTTNSLSNQDILDLLG